VSTIRRKNRGKAAARLHRGAKNDMARFAPRFIRARMSGFEKDMRICLTATENRGASSGITHAYLPALAACFGMLEYLTALYRGNTNRIGWQQIAEFAERYLPQPDFDREGMRVLFEVFRHPIAHRGIASGVWVDRNHGPNVGRRVTWKVSADAKRPACEVIQDPGRLVFDPPWPCGYTHRGHVHLRSLLVDIRKAASRYRREISEDQQLQRNFEACMRQLYPR
jgi:hypothetical protein